MSVMRFLAAVLCAALLAGCSVEADFSDALPTETLEAEKYQQEIAAVDRLLFTESPLGEAGVRSLEQKLTGLSKRVGTLSDSKFLKLESLELQLLAKRAGRLSPAGTGAALQNDWMRIRNNLFDDRAWFVRSAADLEYAASVISPKDPEPEPLPQTLPFDPIVEKRETLSGRWQVTAMFANGEPRTDGELLGSTWTFDAPRLTLRDGNSQETAFNFSAEDGYLALMKTSGDEGWMKYEATDTGIRVAFYDGLGQKPKSFTAMPGQSDPMLVVVHLVAVR
jgi:hypothetical protein